jgi:hypothetical protein
VQNLTGAPFEETIGDKMSRSFFPGEKERVNFLKEYETARMEKELEEGYKANYTYYANLNKEWEFADSE